MTAALAAHPLPVRGSSARPGTGRFSWWIDRGGIAICEAELRYKLRWNEARLGSLLDVLADLEASGLVESALHFRLTDRGRAELPADYQPRVRVGSGVSWGSS